MRDIKFRAWVTSNKGDWHGCDNYDEFDWDNRMRDVGSMYFPLGSYSGKDISLTEIKCAGNDNYASGWTASNECELMQYTGRKDINGNDIYDGDILKHHGIVKWCNEFHQWTAIDLNWNDNREVHDLDYLTSPFEIIGNIYENPELIAE